MPGNYKIGVIIGATLASGYQRAVGTARSDLGTLGKSIKDLSSQRGLIERFEKDRAALGKARIEFSAAQKEVMRLKLALRKGTGDATAKDLEKAQAKAQRLNTTLEKTRERVTRTERAMESAGIEVGDYANQYTRLGRTLDTTRTKYEKLESRMAKKSAAGQRLSDMRGQMLGLAGAAYLGGRLIGNAADFGYEKAFLATVINAEDTEKAVDEAGRYALDYARKNLSTESEMIDINYALSSAGLDAQAAKVGSDIVAKVKTITRGSAGQVGEVVATVFNNLGESLEGNTKQRLTRIGELLTRTQFKFQIRDFGQLGESMKYASPVLKQFNIDLTQGVSLIGALNSAGLQGSQAGTALSATMRNMSKASRELGFELARNADGGIDVIETMKNLDAAVGGLGNLDQDTSDQLQQIFGEEGIRMVTLLGSKLEKLDAAQQDVAESSKGIIGGSYQRFLKTSRGQLTLFTNNIRILGTVLASTLLPAVNAVLRPVTGLMGWIGVMIERMPWLTSVIGGAVGALLAVKAAMIIGTAAVWAFYAALGANPLTWVVMGIGAAVGLIVYYWEPIVGFFEGIWKGIKNIFNAGVNFLVTVWKKSPLGLLFSAGNKLAGFVGGLFSGDEKPDEAPESKPKKKRSVGRTVAAAALGVSMAVAPAAAAPVSDHAAVQTNRAIIQPMEVPVQIPEARGTDRIQPVVNPVQVPQAEGIARIRPQMDAVRVPEATGTARIHQVVTPVQIPEAEGSVRVHPEVGPVQVPEVTSAARIQPIVGPVQIPAIRVPEARGTARIEPVVTPVVIPEAEATARINPEMAARVNAMAPTVAASSSVNHYTANFTINAAPGMNEEKIASLMDERLQRFVDDREAAAAARQRGALYD